jgi:catalase
MAKPARRAAPKKAPSTRRGKKTPKPRPERALTPGSGSGVPPPTVPQDKVEALGEFRDQPANTVLTTDQAIAVPHTDDSLKGGARGPTLLDDFHLREKITRFDHERIPERVVHARGSGAHGFFQVYESLADLTAADFLCDPETRTPVFTRFSTVVGSRGSTDLARDVRGFATKFYTREGNFDLVGNNMPVFFIQDGIKFPDLVHAVKPEPHHEMPQAASAHDTFWDFVSLMPETMHMVMWVMSDRALPRSYRMMEGFGVHTFRLVNRQGRSVLVKFHWKPLLGAHSVVWDEAQKISGRDPDFHRRDLWEAIDCGNYAEYELGLQVMAESDELAFGFDLLDATKLVPEELVPVRRVGKLTLNRNPDNFFAETEQVAFHVGNVVPGIDVTNDPLLQARLFSYLDTQLLRLGGPNFAELPINRPLAPVHNHHQDGFSRRTIPTARALYHPNSIAQNQPALADPQRGFVHFAERVTGRKTRERSASFLDHFSQARMFLHSQSAPEREHLVDACRFELGKVQRLAIRERVIGLFRQIDEEFATEVADGIGVSMARLARPPAPGQKVLGRKAAPTKARSPALSLMNQPRESIRSRKVAVLTAEGVRADELEQVRAAVCGAGASVDVIAASLGQLRSVEGRPVDVDKTFATAASVLYDATYVPGGTGVEQLSAAGPAVHWVREAFLHAKPIGASNEGVDLVARAQLPGIDADTSRGKRRGTRSGTTQGVVLARSDQLEDFASQFVDAIRQHRHFDRDLRTTPA